MSFRFLWQKNHFHVAEQLKKSQIFYITKPDKGEGVAILNYSDYVCKMLSILNDNRKFLKIGDVICDNTLRNKVRLQKTLLELHKGKFYQKKFIIILVP